ncbi:MAG: hypothetical protein OQK79_09140 [Rhodanobacter sp.]|jgi:hypothetical protein|nr:hypothetical protein [Rhodanobacter sp.]
MVDPQRMNWLWRLIWEVAGLQPTELVDALHAMRIPVDQRLVRSWLLDNRDERFSTMSMTEIERNLRAIAALRHARREAAGKPPLPAAKPAEPVTPADDSTAAPEYQVYAALAAELAARAQDD